MAGGVLAERLLRPRRFLTMPLGSMAENERSCPTCGTAVPADAQRCVACGRVLGEENRCPHCQAVAAVVRASGRTVCAACGKPRAGSVVLGTDGSSSLVAGTTTLSGVGGRALRGFGVLALGGSVLLAVLAAVMLPGAVGIGVAVVAGLLGVGLGGLAIRAGARAMARADQERGRAREQRVLELAEQEGGRLTATRLARELAITLEEADGILTGMVGDGSRVSPELDERGVVVYVFRELGARRVRGRIRVEAEDDSPEREVPVETEATRRKETAGS